MDKVTTIKKHLKCGCIDLVQLDEKKVYWELNIIGGDVRSFFREVWPFMTFGDMAKMRHTAMLQVLWSAHGYGLKVLVNGASW